jgi:predicted phage terminase large subunit-like protein
VTIRRAPAQLPREAIVTPATFMLATSRDRFIIPRHIELIEDVVLRAIAAGDRLITIEAPVRHGKSFYLDWHLPAWYLGSFPHKNVGLASYEHRFAASWGQRARDTLDEFGQNFGILLDPQIRSRDWWQTERGGAMRSMGVGGAITGKGFDLLIIDDPIKNAAQANSAVYREAHWTWLQSTALTRVEPGGIVIVTMARWHEDDLIGRIHQEMPDEWTNLRLPALAEPDDAMGRDEGEPLWPERFSAENLERRKRRVGSFWFNALYQQRPSPPSGRIFQRHWWRRYAALPDEFDSAAWSWDMSFKDGKDSSYVVGQCWGVRGADYYLRHQVRGRWDYPTTKATLQAQVGDPRYADAANLVLIEDKANGPAIIADLQHDMSGLIPVATGADSKIGRATSVSGIVESGNVYLPEQAEWVDDYIEEHAQFPFAANDDQVDSTSQLLRELSRRSGASVWAPSGRLPVRA